MLYHCNTIGQAKIAQWLEGEGITAEDIAHVELLEKNKVRITNPAGQYMDLEYANETVKIV